MRSFEDYKRKALKTTRYSLLATPYSPFAARCYLRSPYNVRFTISCLISAIAFEGFNPFGHTSVQFMIVWQR